MVWLRFRLRVVASCIAGGPPNPSHSIVPSESEPRRPRADLVSEVSYMPQGSGSGASRWGCFDGVPLLHWRRHGWPGTDPRWNAGQENGDQNLSAGFSGS